MQSQASELNLMKNKILLLAAMIIAAVSFTGCATDQSAKIQNFLNTALPATFTGDAHVQHFNPYFDFSIDAGGLRKANGVWVWDSMNFIRHDRFTHGQVQLKPKVALSVPVVTP